MSIKGFYVWHLRANVENQKIEAPDNHETGVYGRNNHETELKGAKKLYLLMLFNPHYACFTDRKLIKCALCERTFKDNRGLSVHVKKEHDDITWNQYKKTHPTIEVQAPEPPIIEDSPDSSDTHLDERIDRLETIVNTFLSGYDMTGKPSGISDFPGTEIEITGEKVNYKISLNPAIFSRYDKFKAVVLRRGKEWKGDFSDFIDMSTKDVLAVYGIYDTVVEFRDGRILVEVPAEVNRIG